MSVPAVLRRAADEIEKRGLAKGYYYKRGRKWAHHDEAMQDSTVSCCALGALRIAQNYEFDLTEATHYFTEFLRKRSKDRWQYVAEWNDQTHRTQAQVTKYLRAAADQYEEESK